MAEATLSVRGMDCSGCERNIEFALATIQGVTRARADHEGKFVEVEFDGAVTSEEEVRRVIEDAGYEVMR